MFIFSILFAPFDWFFFVEINNNSEGRSDIETPKVLVLLFSFRISFEDKPLHEAVSFIYPLLN